jgi:hypothetical protein
MLSPQRCFESFGQIRRNAPFRRHTFSGAVAEPESPTKLSQSALFAVPCGRQIEIVSHSGLGAIFFLKLGDPCRLRPLVLHASFLESFGMSRRFMEQLADTNTSQ